MVLCIGQAGPILDEDEMLYARRVRVLVVDDEPSICKALTIALHRAGYDAIFALSGEEAMTRLRAEHIDVLVVDLRMPDMRGDVLFELAVAVQPQLRAQSLFITGDITDRAMRLIGACRCPMVRKPFDLRDVFDAVAALAPQVADITA